MHDDEIQPTPPEQHDTWLEDALHKMKARFMVGGWTIGAAAGAVRWLNGPGDAPLYERMLVALGLTLLAGSLGGFLGVFAHNVLGLLFKKEDGQSSTADDAVSGVALGSFVGAFIGFIAMLALGNWAVVDHGAAWGAGIGALLGALPGGAMRVLLRMMALDSRAGKEERKERKERKR